MQTRRLLILTALGFALIAPVRAQLIELSFDTPTTFQDDAVETNQYFRLPPDSVAHFDLRFNPARPRDGGDSVHLRVTGGDGSLVFAERRGLDGIGTADHWYSFRFTASRSTGPVDHRFYEDLRLELSLTDGWMHEDGHWVPPEIDIDVYSQLYVSGYSPMIGYVPPGYAGFYRFGPDTSNVTYQIVPVPEPSTYGIAALALLGCAVLGRRLRGRATCPPVPVLGFSDGTAATD